MIEKPDTNDTAMQEAAMYQAVFDMSAIGIAMLKPDNTFLKVNQALCDLLAYSERELLKKSCLDIIDSAYV